MKAFASIFQALKLLPLGEVANAPWVAVQTVTKPPSIPTPHTFTNSTNSTQTVFHGTAFPITTTSDSPEAIPARRQGISPSTGPKGATAATGLVSFDATDLLSLAINPIEARQVDVQPTSPTGVPAVTIAAVTVTGIPDELDLLDPLTSLPILPRSPETPPHFAPDAGPTWLKSKTAATSEFRMRADNDGYSHGPSKKELTRRGASAGLASDTTSTQIPKRCRRSTAPQDSDFTFPPAFVSAAGIESNDAFSIIDLLQLKKQMKTWTGTQVAVIQALENSHDLYNYTELPDLLTCLSGEGYIFAPYEVYYLLTALPPNYFALLRPRFGFAGQWYFAYVASLECPTSTSTGIFKRDRRSTRLEDSEFSCPIPTSSGAPVDLMNELNRLRQAHTGLEERPLIEPLELRNPAVRERTVTSTITAACSLETLVPVSITSTKALSDEPWRLTSLYGGPLTGQPWYSWRFRSASKTLKLSTMTTGFETVHTKDAISITVRIETSNPEGRGRRDQH